MLSVFKTVISFFRNFIALRLTGMVAAIVQLEPDSCFKRLHK
jgi:hypothetical protein